MTIAFHASVAAIVVLVPQLVNAHPGSGIFVKDDGSVVFVDTGRGVWQWDSPDRPATLITDVAMHFLAIDPKGAFAEAPTEFGEWFDRITPRGERPALISCSDFPCTIGPDGNLYFPYMHGLTIKRRTPSGDETIVARPGDFGYDDEHSVGVNGIASASDGTIYIVLLDDLHQSRASTDHWLYAINPKRNVNNHVTLIKKNFIQEDQLIPTTEQHHESIRQYCRGLAVDRDNNVYIACTGNRSVLKVPHEGDPIVVLRCQKPWSPTAVAVHNGSVFVLEYDDETPTEGRNWPPRVRRLDSQGHVDELITVDRKLTQR
jgi:hypothetical protein